MKAEIKDGKLTVTSRGDDGKEFSAAMHDLYKAGCIEAVNTTFETWGLVVDVVSWPSFGCEKKRKDEELKKCTENKYKHKVSNVDGVKYDCFYMGTVENNIKVGFGDEEDCELEFLREHEIMVESGQTGHRFTINPLAEEIDPVAIKVLGDRVREYVGCGCEPDLKPDEECKDKKTCVRGCKIDHAFIDELEDVEFHGVFCVSKDSAINQGGCVDPSNESCEMKCECFGFEESRKKARNFINRKKLEIIEKANLERDEILKKAHEDACRIINDAKDRDDRATVHYRGTVKQCDTMIEKAKQKSQEASSYYRVTVEECRNMTSDCHESSLKSLKECREQCDEMIEEAKAEAENIKREAILNTSNITINVTGTSGNVVEDINNALAEKMGIKNRI